MKMASRSVLPILLAVAITLSLVTIRPVAVHAADDDSAGASSIAAVTIMPDEFGVNRQQAVQTAQTTVSAFVTRFYQIFFNRDPDECGLAYWTTALLNKSTTGANTAAFFVDSREFKELKVNDSTYLDMMYRAFFNREGDAGGKAYWQSSLENGMSRYWILWNFVNSSEFQGICTDFGIVRGSLKLTRPADLYPKITAFVTRFYKFTLQRMPDADGLDYWVSSLKSGTRTGASLAYEFLNSQEFIVKIIGTEPFIDILYRTFLDRGSDAAGMAYWGNRLALGYSRHYLLVEFVNSPEFANICSSYQITRGDLAHWIWDRSISGPLTMYLRRDSSNRISLHMGVLNTSGKTITSMTAILESFGHSGPAIDMVTGKSRFTVTATEVILPDKQFTFTAQNFMQSVECGCVAVDWVTLKFSDGTTMLLDYMWYTDIWYD